MANKDDSSASNAFSSEEQRLGGDAQSAFLQSQYEPCITMLKKIQKSHPGDCKLMHNRALAEFLKSGQTKPLDLKKAFLKVNKVSQQSHQDDEDLPDEVILNEYSILRYNQALLYYFLHQYAEAQSLLEPMAHAPDPPHNIQSILLLLVEVYLSSHDSEKARNDQEMKEKITAYTNIFDPIQGKAQKFQTKDVKLMQSLLKIRCCLQMKSMKRGNYYKAYKVLGSSPPSNFINTYCLQNGDSLLTMFYNNLGVIHFQLSKHALGSFYFGKALEENDKAISTNLCAAVPSKKDNKHQQSSSNAKTIHALNMNKKFELLYNAGIQLLFSGKPSAAFDCLISSVQVFYHNPRLWLRLAECCIQSTCSPDKSEGGGNSVMPCPTLEFASVCLHNALTILAEAGISGIDIIESKKNIKNNQQSVHNKSEISVKCPPTGSVSGRELSSLHASILVNSAFVALSLGNNLMAHEYSKVLLQLPNISNRHMYLGKMYSAEALVSLDRISDAIQHLSSDTVADISDYKDPSSNKPLSSADDGFGQAVGKPVGPRTTQCCFKSVKHAQACMLLNRAVAHSLRSEFEKAQKLVNQFAALVPQEDVPPTVTLLAVYISLHTHGLQAAIKILQHNSLLPHMSSTVINNLQMAFRPQQPSSGMASKPFATAVAISPSGTGSSGGSVSGGSTGSRSKSSTPQPHHSNPPSGSVTPERVVKSQQLSNKPDSGGSKSKRNRR